MTNFLLDNDMKAYQYKISYKGKYSFMDFYGVDASKLGVCHADELFYLFQPCYEVYVELPENDLVLSQELLSYWTNFAKFGDPTPPDSESKGGQKFTLTLLLLREPFWAHNDQKKFSIFTVL